MLDVIRKRGGLDLVDWFRIVGVVGIWITAFVLFLSAELRLSAVALATGGFAFLHLVITIASRAQENSNLEPREKEESTDVWERGVKLLGKELEARLVDEEARNREVTKQYVAVAGVCLTLVVALIEKGSLETSVGASSLAVSIALGLILLERLTGSTTVKLGHYALSIMYHLMCWSLFFGLLSILSTSW